jgi:hypothetical protein
MLGGSARPGSWLAVRVSLSNSGPAIDGELRLTALGAVSSTQGLRVELAPGANQEHVVYVRTTAIGRRLRLALVAGSETVATTDLTYNQQHGVGAYIVAERPHLLSGPVAEAVRAAGLERVTPVALAPEDLPGKSIAWSSVDLLVWQDIDFGRLDGDQLAALRTWLVTGGDLVLIAGSLGPAPLAGLPDELLPYRPTHEAEADLAQLQAALGELPPEPSPLPLLAGDLQRGRVLIEGGGAMIAARTQIGHGSVTLAAIDATAPSLAGSAAGAMLWRRTLPTSLLGQDEVLPQDDSFLDRALGSLPTVQVPRSDHLALLILAYILALGPINYLVLRRRDRREWAWLTMPVTILLFGVITFGYGSLLRGGSVIVNQLGIVQGAAGASVGLADVHVGVYSPARADFQVRVGGGPLVSAPSTSEFDGGPREERPLDVLQGDTATVRSYGVSHGALRSFRAQAAVSTPRIDSELRLNGQLVEGSVSNASGEVLEDVSLVVGTAVMRLGDIAPGETLAVSLDTARRGTGRPLSSQLYPVAPDADPAGARSRAARRAIIQHLEGGGNPWFEDEMFGGEFGGEFGGSASGLKVRGPVLLAWHHDPVLDVDVGQAADQVSETLYLISVPASISGPVRFSGGLVQRGPVITEAMESWDNGDTLQMSGGTMTTEYRAVGIEGSFTARVLKIRMSDSPAREPRGEGERLAPLPDDEQPDPDNPLGTNPRRPDRMSSMPRLQLFDRVLGQWVEMEPVEPSRTYDVAEPERYLDDAGSFRVRFVAGREEYVHWAFAAAIEGDVE